MRAKVKRVQVEEKDQRKTRNKRKKAQGSPRATMGYILPALYFADAISCSSSSSNSMTYHDRSYYNDAQL